MVHPAEGLSRVLAADGEAGLAAAGGRVAELAVAEFD